jgi:hypothetical protein
MLPNLELSSLISRIPKEIANLAVGDMHWYAKHMQLLKPETLRTVFRPPQVQAKLDPKRIIGLPPRRPGSNADARFLITPGLAPVPWHFPIRGSGLASHGLDCELKCPLVLCERRWTGAGVQLRRQVGHDEALQSMKCMV